MTAPAPVLSLVYPYFENPGMLGEQYRAWAGYPEALKACVELVLVDDGTPQCGAPAHVVARPAGLPSLRIYRVLENRPWHQHGARNLGAHEAVGQWLFLSDMDHVLPATSLAALVPRLNYDVVYTFRRLDAPDLQPKLKHGVEHPHPNTFAMTRRRYWQVGGYDEDCTGYGTDGFFRERLCAEHPAVHLWDAPIVRYSRAVIGDASTTSLPRKEGDRPSKANTRAMLAAKAAQGRGPTVLDFSWERVV